MTGETKKAEMRGETNKAEVERVVLDPIRWVSDGFISMAAAQAEAQTNAEAEAATAPGPSPPELGESRIVRIHNNTSESCSDEQKRGMHSTHRKRRNSEINLSVCVCCVNLISGNGQEVFQKML
jgi:hypothetical protein